MVKAGDQVMELKRYEEHWKCPKCGSDLVTSDYRDMIDLIRRKCSNCGYYEDQLPLDKKEG